MTLLEPTTVLTDYVLGVLGVSFGLRLWRGAAPEEGSRRLWAVSLIAMAAAAFAGGTAHGFADRLGAGGNWILWRITVWGVGAASLCLAAAMARFALPKRWADIVVGILALQFAIYAIWMLTHDGFVFVIAEYLPAMLLVLILAARQTAKHGWPGGRWVAGGVVVSFTAAGVQASGLSLHQHFNHNDLYHVIQMLGVYLLYRGGLLLEEPRILQPAG